MARKTEKQIYGGRTSPERIRQIMQERGVSEARAKQIARGHGTSPEHGKEEPLGLFGTGKQERALYETRSGQRAKSMLVQANRYGQEVSVEYFVKDEAGENPRPRILVLPGYGSRIPASWLLYDKGNPDRIGSIANLKKWLENQPMTEAGSHRPSGGAGTTPANQITRIRISVFGERVHAAA